MWDPSFGLGRNRISRELRLLSASLIAGRRRVSGGESTTVTRSGPTQQPIVDAIVRAITKQ